MFDGKLLSLNEFLPKNANSPSTVRYAHSRVSHNLVQKCGIPHSLGDLSEASISERCDFFEEYSQEESIIYRISNTIKESSLWSSLNEFVANAEDCGTATKAYWILDSEKSQFPSKSILCDELEEWQTPALYFYTDGVFTDSDFKALIDIGMGSKARDSSKIGKYGLGSLTMYLFTDIPSMISGEWFIIIDPTRQYLPVRNPPVAEGRAAYVLNSHDMRPKYCDQLAPFVGIGGYTLGTTSRIQLTKLDRLRQFSGHHFPISYPEPKTSMIEVPLPCDHPFQRMTFLEISWRFSTMIRQHEV